MSVVGCLDVMMVSFIVGYARDLSILGKHSRCATPAVVSVVVVG